MTAVPVPSAVSSYIHSSLDSGRRTHPAYLHHLAAQVLHNLQYQHDWTALQIHTHSSILPVKSCDSSQVSQLLPRPIISGIPPSRVYIHPDEQIEIIKAGIKDSDLPLEREWVLPSHLKEKWSLKCFGDVFDSIEAIPTGLLGEDDEEMRNRAKKWHPMRYKWRQTKRAMLATVDDDSTVVYYVIQDGIVKPRQN